LAVTGAAMGARSGDGTRRPRCLDTLERLLLGRGIDRALRDLLAAEDGTRKKRRKAHRRAAEKAAH
jgi:hypothetical protein